MKAMQKIGVGGIKLSAKLIQLNIVDTHSFSPSVLPLFQILKENKINMPFISTAFSEDSILFTCCISAPDWHCVKKLITSKDMLGRKVAFISDVGLISIYPHRSSFKILGLALRALEDTGIPVLGMSSSVSSLTFIVKYAEFDRAVTALIKHLDLPEGYVPLGPDAH